MLIAELEGSFAMGRPCPYQCVIYYLVNFLVYQLCSASPGRISLKEQDEQITSPVTTELLDDDLQKDAVTPPPAKPLGDMAVRCYCNLPECVPTGYMCKSSRGACFTRHLLQQQGVPHSGETPDEGDSPGMRFRGTSRVPVTGCLEYLDKINQEQCLQKRESRTAGTPLGKDPTSGTVSSSRGLDSKSSNSISCCFEDVCNYNDHPLTVYFHNDPGAGAASKKETNSYGLFLFKAATITVPIVGLIILVILIFMAGKILRSNGAKGSKENKKHPFKVLLFHGDHFSGSLSSTRSTAPIISSKSMYHPTAQECPDSLQPAQRYLESPFVGARNYPSGDLSSTPYTSASTVFSKDASLASLEELEPLNHPKEGLPPCPMPPPPS